MNAHGFIPAARIIGLLFILPVLVTLPLGIYFYRSTNSFIARSVACQGQVVENVHSTGDNGDAYAPAFTFTDAAGTIHHGQSSISTNPPSYAVGQSIKLRYDPRNTDDVRIDSFWSLWLGSLICAGMTIPPLIIGAVFFLLFPFTIRRVWPQPAQSAVYPPPLPR